MSYFFSGKEEEDRRGCGSGEEGNGCQSKERGRTQGNVDGNKVFRYLCNLESIKIAIIIRNYL